MSGKKQPRNGKPASTLTEPPLKNEYPFRRPSAELQRVLRSVYNQYQRLDSAADNDAARRDFVFHMTDWINDLEQLAALYADPKKLDKDAAGSVVFSFLIHAVPHLMEAGRLLEGHDIRNPFVDTEAKP